MGQHEVRHMIGGERAFEAVRRHLPGREYVAGIVNKHVDARLGGGDFPANPLHLGKDRQVGDMGAMGNVGTCLPECCEGGVRTPAVARHQDDACLKSGQLGGGNLSNTGRGAGDDDDLAVNGSLLGSDTRFRMRPSLTPKFGQLQIDRIAATSTVW
jgi:hypothetical protein